MQLFERMKEELEQKFVKKNEMKTYKGELQSQQSHNDNIYQSLQEMEQQIQEVKVTLLDKVTQEDYDNLVNNLLHNNMAGNMTNANSSMISNVVEEIDGNMGFMGASMGTG